MDDWSWLDRIDCESWENSQYNYSNKKKKEPKQVCKFKVGDIVRLKNGTAEIRVTYISGTYLSGEYVKSGTYVTHRHQEYFVHFTKDDNQKEKAMSTNTLYQFTVNVNAFAPTQCFGTHIGTNSQGQWIMEVKGTGQIVAINKDDVEEVLPYSIGVRYSNNGITYHYLADKDKFDVGFYLVKDASDSGWQIARVVEVDTKSKKATVEFKPIGKLAVDMY
jgi:uncharacterized protein YodC (DUF2158 family)